MSVNHCVLLAGGVGSRFGASVPKQFVEVDGVPIIVYTIRRMQVKSISDISIVCIEDWIPHLRDLIEKFELDNVKRIIPGGNTAHQSIYNGLLGIEDFCEPNDIVLIHDSVRPLVPESVLLDSIDKAIAHGTGCASLDTIEGLVVKDDDFHGSKVADRYNIVRIQTPQAYRYGLIRKLYDDAMAEGKEYPYADGICLSNGVPIYFSKSFPANTKITTRQDIAFMKAMMTFTDDELLGEL